jgi:hypothetical protein
MTPRNCQKVIIDMIEKIPADQQSLISDLQWNYEDAGYKAPEETLQWERTSMTLQKHMSSPKEEWEFVVLSVFTTHDVDTLKEMVKSNEG